MKRLILTLPFVFFLLLSRQVAAAEELRVGVAQIDITPPVGFRKGGGYGEVISTGVRDPLFAKSIVLRQGGVSVALVFNDLLSVPPDLSRSARQRASEQTGIPAENIVIAATHNHGSPEYWGPLRDLAHEAALDQHGSDARETIDYQKKLVWAWSQVIGEADRVALPVTMDVCVARQPGLAFNRRYHMRDGSVRFNPGHGNPEIVRPAGPIDPDIPVVLFRRYDGAAEPIASLTTFAMHTAVDGGGTVFTADFPAVLQTRLQQKFGDAFISLFAEGTAGDINHIDVHDTNQLQGPPEVHRIGNALADAVLAELERARRRSPSDLAATSETIQVSFPAVGEARYQQAKQLLRNQKTGRTPFLELVAAWRDCHRHHHRQHYGDRKPLEVQAIRLNADTAIVTLPHEVFVEIGLAIKATSPFRNTIVISLANDVDYYIPTRRAFEEGSYEVTTCPLDPGCGELLLDAARRVLQAVKRMDGYQPRSE